jgi:hypothetical protein
MIKLPRIALSTFTLAFGVYHAILGVLNIAEYQGRTFAAVSIVLYLVGLAGAVGSFPGLRMRAEFAWFALFVAITVPLLMSVAISRDAAFGYTTWHVAGVSTLMAITAVRQHSVLAWIGVAFLIIQTLIWGGPDVLFTSGVFGAFLLVLAAQATASLLSSSARAADEALDRAVLSDAKTAANTAARAERQKRIQETLREALPLLEMIVHRKGKLSIPERFEAALKEHELRDQIRGRALLLPKLVAATRAARTRGVEVQLLDDGGLDGLDEGARKELLLRAAKELASIDSGKVVIRAVAGETWRLTMAAIRKDADRPDLFLRL